VTIAKMSTAAATELAIDGDRSVFVTSSSAPGAVYYVPLTDDGGVATDGGQPITVLGNQQHAGGPTTDGTHLYWIEVFGSQIHESLPDGGDPTYAVSSGNNTHPESTIIDNTYLYWLSGFLTAGSPDKAQAPASPAVNPERPGKNNSSL